MPCKLTLLNGYAIIDVTMTMKNKLDRLAPPPVGDDPTKLKIIDTIEQLGLDPRQVTLVGSAALKMYDISLFQEVDIYNPGTLRKGARPSDVDLTVPAAYWDELRINSTTPQGVPVDYNESISHRGRAVDNNILNAHHSSDLNLLPVDIITRFNGYNLARHDANFTKFHDKFDHLIPDTQVRIQSLGRIAAELTMRSGDGKANGDLAAIRNQSHRLTSRK